MVSAGHKMVIAVLTVGSAVAVSVVVFSALRRRRDDEVELAFGPTKTRPVTGELSNDDLDVVKDDRKVFLEYGVTLRLPPNWEAVVDDISMGPQIAVIRLQPPDHDAAAPGEAPGLSLIIEDVDREQMTLLAYKEKSKEYATTAAGGLSLLSALEITKDAPVSVGPFQHTLEYTQMLPGVAARSSQPYQFMNLMALHNGVAYVLQYMARRDLFFSRLDTVRSIAEGIAIRNLPQRPASKIVFLSQPHSLQVTVPGTWSLVQENKDLGDGRTLVVSFATGSSNKPDRVSLYVLSKAESSPSAMAERYREILRATGEITVKDAKRALFSYTADGKLVVAYCRKDCVLECSPEGERVTHHSQAEDVVTAVLDSVKPVRHAAPTECRYENSHHRFSFAMGPLSKLLEHKWGSTCITYLPVPEEPDTVGPVFTVEVATEEDVYPDLKAVEAKIMASHDPDITLQRKRIETHAEREFLTFMLTRAEATPWGQAEEFRSQILVGLRGAQTIMLKWEVPAADWIQHEHHLTAILKSLRIDP